MEKIREKVGKENRIFIGAIGEGRGNMILKYDREKVGKENGIFIGAIGEGRAFRTCHNQVKEEL